MRVKFSQLSLGLLTIVTSLNLANSVKAISFDLSWNGNNGYYMTGTFTYNDGNPAITADNLIKSSDSEIDSMTISFFNASNNQLANYDLTALQNDSSFNFNFQISPIAVLQNGTQNQKGAIPGIYGLYLGDGANGYTLASNGSGLNFDDNNANLNLSSGGSVTATAAVPFEFSPTLGFIMSGGIFGGLYLIKRFRKKVYKK